MRVDVCKEKKLTNMRSSKPDIAARLSPHVEQSLEDALDFIADDEILEVTPKNIRVRKRVLSNDQRHRLGRERARVPAAQ